jgi:hypothetical protein
MRIQVERSLTIKTRREIHLPPTQLQLPQLENIELGIGEQVSRVLSFGYFVLIKFSIES